MTKLSSEGPESGRLSGSGQELSDDWRGRGRTTQVLGRRVFYLDTGSPRAGTLLVLHGFPTSSFDFHRVLPALAERYRVVLHDHLGFGFSEKPGDYSYSLIEQAEIAIALWRGLGIESGHLVAHDYGTSVATELLARRRQDLLPPALESVSFCNGSVFLELARLRLSQRLARSKWTGPLFAQLIGPRYFKRVLRRLWGSGSHRGDKTRAVEADLDAMWIGLTAGGGRKRTTRISSYLDERVRFRERWTRPLNDLDLPALVLWGRRDPVAVPAIAERLAAEIPLSTLVWLEGLGHYPMLEDPDAWSGALLGFLDSIAARG